METINDIFKKSPASGAILTSAVVAAIIGGLFGYYGAQKTNNPSFSTVPIGSTIPYTGISDEEQKTIAVVKKASASVVSIVATRDIDIAERANPFQSFCGDPFFQQFFGDQCEQAPAPRRQQRQQIAAGTGFIVSADGLVLTNKHVVDSVGASFTVITNDGKKYAAVVKAKDPVRDIALISVKGTNLPALALGDSVGVKIGQTVIAIGNALGEFSNSVSKGIISGVARSIVAGDGVGSSERLDQLFQTDAAINPGNSGGPLLNLAGQVIGINTAIVNGAQNIGFAIPINQAKGDIEQVKKGGKITAPFLGVRYVMINEEIKKNNSLTVDYGALVIHGDTRTDLAVMPGSPADIAGIRENDIILEAEGKRLTNDNPLGAIIQNHAAGDSILLKILRQGKEITVTVILKART